MKQLKQLRDYIPEKARPRIEEMCKHCSFELKIVKKRVTKHGDFKKYPDGRFQITVNENLNPPQFLLTLVHEIAHYMTYQTYGNVPPHGREWKKTFQHLMLPFLHPAIYPPKVLSLLAKHMICPKASSESDPKLAMALKDSPRDPNKKYIFELNEGDAFLFRKRRFVILKKRRTRYLCRETSNSREYTLHQNTEVHWSLDKFRKEGSVSQADITDQKA